MRSLLDSDLTERGDLEFFLSTIKLLGVEFSRKPTLRLSFSGAGCRGRVFVVTLGKVGCGHVSCASGEEFQNRLH